MASSVSLNSTDSDVFFVEQRSSEPNPQRNSSPNVFNSTELSGMHIRENPTLSSVTSLEPDIVTLDDDSNDTTFHTGFEYNNPMYSRIEMTAINC